MGIEGRIGAGWYGAEQRQGGEGKVVVGSVAVPEDSGILEGVK